MQASETIPGMGGPSSQPVAEESWGLNLQRYWNLVKKHRWLILATFIAVVGGVVSYSMTRTKIYQATATIVVEPQAPKVLGKDSQNVVELGAGSNYWSLKEYYNTQARILKSRSLVKKAVVEFGLHRDARLGLALKPGSSEEDQIEATTSFIGARLKVAIARDTRLLSVQVKHPDGKLAADVANYLTKVYVDQNLAQKQTTTRDARGYLAQKLDDATRNLQKSETAFYTFKVDVNLKQASFEEHQRMLAKQLESYTEALAGVQRRRIELQARRKAVARLLANDAIETPSNYVAESATVEKAREIYLEEQRKLRGLEERYGPKHPEVTAQQARLASSLEDVKREAKVLLASIDGEVSALGETEGRFQGEVSRLTAEVSDLNKKEPRYQELKREAEHSNEVYKQLLARYNESGLQEQDFSNNIRPLDEARAPAAPVEPNLRRSLAVGIFLGLFFAFGLAFLVEMLDRSVKSQEDIEAGAGLSFLGMVPTSEEARGVSQKERDLHILRNPKGTVAECCRVVRTNILFCGAARPLKTLIVTSPNPVEGKTTTAINLGIVMAQSGARTLLIDADMRRPRLHKVFGQSGEHGLSRLILGEGSLEDAVKTTDVPNLWLMPCGPVPPNPAELLQTEQFVELLRGLGKTYDRVIIDTPPILAVTDPAIVSRVADGVVMVVRAGKTLRDDIMRAKRSLGQVSASVVGVIMNDVNLKHAQYAGYYYSYRYGYYHQNEQGQPSAPSAHGHAG